MSVYDKLVIVDQFEERNGNQRAVRRACEIMLAYLASLKQPLPEVAAQALRVARGYTDGSVGAGSLSAAVDQISRFLKECGESENNSKGVISIIRASAALLKLLQEPTWGGGASEALSNFLEWTDEFEQNHELFGQLLERYVGGTDS